MSKPAEPTPNQNDNALPPKTSEGSSSDGRSRAADRADEDDRETLYKAVAASCLIVLIIGACIVFIVLRCRNYGHDRTYFATDVKSANEIARLNVAAAACGATLTTNGTSSIAVLTPSASAALVPNSNSSSSAAGTLMPLLQPGSSSTLPRAVVASALQQQYQQQQRPWVTTTLPRVGHHGGGGVAPMSVLRPAASVTQLQPVVGALNGGISAKSDVKEWYV